MKRLLVLIGADCDPDRPNYGGHAYDRERELSWRGIEFGIPQAAEAVSDVPAPGGARAHFPVTWCIRSDQQMYHVYNSYSWCYTEYHDIWSGLLESEHELAWHPHLWRWDTRSRCWFQETEDGTWIRDGLAAGLRDLRESGVALTSCRTGWNYHSNVTMRTCSEIGIEVDFSALPGESCGGYRSDRGSVFHGAFDWASTPVRPYYPCKTDYRRDCEGPEASLGILELPMVTAKSWALAALVGARNVIRRRSWVWPRRHALRITAHPALFSLAVEQAFRDHAPYETGLLGAYFHPDELLFEGRAAGRLTSVAHLRSNLCGILAKADARGVEVVGVTASEAAAYFRAPSAGVGTGGRRPPPARPESRTDRSCRA